MEDASPETITTADLILSIVPPGEAVALAEGFVKRLSESRHKPVFIDCNALSPKTKIQVAVTLAETGCDVIDGAIIGRWVAEMREIADFLSEDKAAAMIFEGAAQLYDRLATDIASEGQERRTLDEFLRSK